MDFLWKYFFCKVYPNLITSNELLEAPMLNCSLFNSLLRIHSQQQNFGTNEDWLFFVAMNFFLWFITGSNCGMHFIMKAPYRINVCFFIKLMLHWATEKSPTHRVVHNDTLLLHHKSVMLSKILLV